MKKTMTKNHRLNQKLNGFSLVELMVVVAIIGILASIAMPFYNDYVVRSQRGEGTALALSILRAQENFSINNLTYTTNLTQLGFSDPLDSPNGIYRFTASTCGTTPITDCVLITATARGSQAVDGNLTINSRGERTGNW